MSWTRIRRAAFFVISSCGLVTVADAAALGESPCAAFVKEAYLKASNPDTVDFFGWAVAVSGDTLVVGSRGEASGFANDPADNSAEDSGAVYVFVRDGATWEQQAYLKPAVIEGGDLFGYSVAIDGDTLVVGAVWEDSSATTVNGDATDNGANFSGAAYVFVRDGVTWSQEAYLKASNADAGDSFGESVAIDGDTIVVGSSFEASNASFFSGDPADNSSPGSGAAYVFVRDGSTWSEQAYLKSLVPDEDDRFGISVSISGDTVVVGAFEEDSGSPGVNSNASDNSANNAGAAYVYVRSGTTWSAEAYLKASNTQTLDRFGGAVSVDADTIVVGASGEDSPSTGVNGGQGSNAASSSGAAYVYVRSGTDWSQQAYVKASDTSSIDGFGAALALYGDTLVVGSPGQDDGAPDSGAAYRYERSGSTWSFAESYKASSPGSLDKYGIAIGLWEDTVVFGAQNEDGNSAGVDGDQTNDDLFRSGAVYVQAPLTEPVPTTEAVRVGSPANPAALLPGVTSAPALGALWDPRIDHTTFLPTALLDFLALGLAPTNVPSSFGTILCFPVATFFVAPAGQAFALPIPEDCSLVGAQLCWQGSSWDGPTVALTNALDVTIGTE